MLYSIIYLFLLFFVYSVLGYIAEVITVSICTKKFTPNRGFLIGPYIPIYGMGVICMVRLLTPYKDDLFALFVMSTLVCTVLEYITSVVMEKIFKLRWWDYSHMSFNINGRVCLTNSVLFGIGGLIITKLINPIVEGLLLKIPKIIVIILGIIFALIFIADIVVSLVAMFNIKIEVKKYTKTDATETIKREISEFLHKHNFIRKQIDRLFQAFPNVKSRKNLDFPDYKELVAKIKEEIKEAKEDLKKAQKEYAEKTKEFKEKLTKQK